MSTSLTHPTGAETRAASTPLDPALVERLAGSVHGNADPVVITAPSTGEPLVTLPQCTTEDVEDAFAKARQAQQAWARTDVRDRVRPLQRLRDLVLRRQTEGLDILQAETGKARMHAFEEIVEVALCASHIARRAPIVLAPHRRRGALPVVTRATEYRTPKGVVSVITPWNYPLALSDDVLPALAAGNAVVQKPDSQTALSALWLRSLAEEAGLPKGLWQIVLGTRKTIGDSMTSLPDFVGFTGSTAAGRKIASAAGERLIGCSLELGGKNPLLVLADADLDKAAAGAARACFSNAGQLCISIERIYVNDAVADEFIEKFVAAVRALKLGAETTFDVGMGSLTYRRQLDATSEHVEDAKAKGATVLTGGRARPDLGPLFYEPTVLTDVTPEMSLYAEETFGPVVSIYRVPDDETAIAKANDTEYGLNASVFSRDVEHARSVARRVQAGTININEGYAAAYGSQAAPMGGMKASGLGRRHGDEGLLKVTEAQTVASQHILGFEPALGLSAGNYAKVISGMVGALGKLRLR